MMKRKMPDSYTIRLIRLPLKVGGAICESPDGHVNIYLNDRLSRSGQADALDHELDHWERGDLYNSMDIREVESRGRRMPLPPLVRARDLPPIRQKQSRRRSLFVPIQTFNDWKDDIYLRLPYYE